MLIVKYFAAVGTVLIAGLLALNAYLAPSQPTAPARVLASTTASSLLMVTPRVQARSAIQPEIAPSKVAAAPPPQPTRHRKAR
jgi:hypothetical protein